MIKEKLLGSDYKFIEANVPAGLNESQKKARQLFLDEIHRGGRYTAIDTCPFCAASDFMKISERDSRGLPTEIVSCDGCGGCFKSSTMNPEATRFHYEKISYVLRGKELSESSIEKLFKERVSSFAYPRYNFIRHFIRLDPSRDLIAEFGCGDGANLVPWKREGFDVLGMEFDTRMVEFGGNKGLRLLAEDFMTYDFSKKRPKLVILSHFLEHVSDLGAVLKRLHSILDPHGYLFVEVPGTRVQGLGKPLSIFDVEHNYYFDLGSLSGALRKNSFDIVYGDEYIRILCRPIDVPISAMRQMPSRQRLSDLLMEAERGSLRMKALNWFWNRYFRYYYLFLSAGAGDAKE